MHKPLDNNSEYTKLLHRQCSKLGINAANPELKKIFRWIELLQKWNQTYNLTAIKETEQIVCRLVVGSLAAIPYLHGNTVLDVGSGSGVPGIPLAIFAPQYRYTLIDSNGKKTRFLEHCRVSLTLPNVEIKQVRAENFRTSVKFDTIISRALGNLDQFISITRHLGHKQTCWLTFKGKISPQELQQFRDIASDSGLRHNLKKLNVGEDETQNLVLVRY